MIKHVEIAGAGFAGLTAAIALVQRGWTARVHEKGSDLRAFGAGIFIWENGLRVLKAIGAYDDAMRGSHQAMIYQTRHDNRVVAETPFSLEQGSRMLTMTRQHLYSAILSVAQKLGVEFVTNSEVIGATPEGVLLTSDGRTHHADLVVGADGVKSNVRDSLGLQKERTVYNEGIIRVLVPRSKAELGVGDWDYVIDFWAEAGRGLRILYVPCNEQDLYLAMMAPVNDRAASAFPLQYDIWTSAFPQLAPVIRKINTIGRYDAYATNSLDRWSDGHVAVVGDAAHSMAPTLGQGAGTAMMNALALAVALEDAPSIQEGLATWEANERPLTEYTQLHSEQVAAERAMSTGRGWCDDTLRTARHIPTGTERLSVL